MANVTVGHLVDMAYEVLKDDPASPEHWTQENLLNWYNLGTSKVVALAPEANMIFESIKLAAGVKQSVPASRIAIIDVTRNMGADGNTPGAGITKTDIRILTAYDRSWITGTASATIKNWAPESLTVFYVSPPADGNSYVEIKVAAVPTVVVYDAGGLWESALVGVAEKYVDAVFNWMLFRAYQKDADYPGNDQRANSFHNEFLLACGVTPGVLKGK